MALPCGTTGSLYPTFVPARLVGLTVKRVYAIALYIRLPSVLNTPLGASDTLLEATTPVKLPTMHCPPVVQGLDLKETKGGISLATQPQPESGHQSLPPMLRIIYSKSIQSCSKGARGLSVPLRVLGIFTETTISPSACLRQFPDRYTIRAGRNLPDKEFRYLRTVIVTAAVYRGFGSKLRITPDFSP